MNSLGTLEFYASDWTPKGIFKFYQTYSLLMTVKSVHAEWSSKHNDFEARESADEIETITGWWRATDKDTKDDGASKVILTIEATEMTIHDLNSKIAEIEPC